LSISAPFIGGVVLLSGRPRRAEPGRDEELRDACMRYFDFSGEQNGVVGADAPALPPCTSAPNVRSGTAVSLDRSLTDG
jgi:hypothetical protein